MKFNTELLKEYRNILQTTNLQLCYQEFIRLFRYIRTGLEASMPEYKFQAKIVENSMDYSYFSFTNSELKKKGLKVVVVFIHQYFHFEIWVSGYNRNIQTKYYEKLKEVSFPFQLTEDPIHNDYIISAVIEENSKLSDADWIISRMREVIEELMQVTYLVH